MILQSLVEYYEQLLEDDSDSVAPPGWCPRNIAFMLELTSGGELLNILPAEEKRGWPRMVPEQAKRSSGVEANLLCDNASYLLGIDAKGKPERSLQCFSASKDKHLAFLGDLQSDAALAVKAFFESWQPENALDHAAVKEAGEGLLAGGNLTFRVNGREVLDDSVIKNAWDRSYASPSDGAVVMTCLVTGEKAPIARLHPSIKGVVGARSMGASLIGFNSRAFESYGRDEEQGLNAPVSEYATFAYTTALNYLLADRKHHIRLGDTTVVYWAEKNDAACSGMFSQALGAPSIDDEETNPDDLIDAIMEKLEKGLLPREVDLNATFYVLGLAPNAARVSVRFFLRDTFGTIISNVGKHYKRLDIVHASYERRYLSPYRLLAETANPNACDPAASSVLGGALMRSIIEDLRYPEAFFSNVLLRVRASQDNDEQRTRKVTRGRAAILKACLIKNYHQSEEVVTVSLNEDRDDAPYVLGRLFAILESIQEAANPTIKRTIKATYFDSAASTPASIFPLIIKLAGSHLQKISQDRKGLAVHYEKQVGTLCDKMQAFPKRLSLEDQGSFVLGYYQQVQDRYTKKEDEQEA